MIRRVVGLVLLAGAYGAAAVLATRGMVVPFAVLALAVVAGEAYLVWRAPKLLPNFIDVRLGVSFRLISLDLMVALLGATSFADGTRVAVVVTTVAAVVALRLAVVRLVEARRRLTDPAVGWRAIPGLPAENPSPWQPGRAVVYAAPLSLVLPLSMIVAAPAGRLSTVMVAGGLAVGVLLVALVLELVRRRRVGPGGGNDARERIRDALVALNPEVCLYFGGPASSTHVIDVWLPVLAKLDRRVLVIVRDAWHLETMKSGELPSLHLPKNTDVEYFAVPSLEVALYPTNIAVNNHLIRIPGIFDVFVGHGDSDKGGSATPISRIYDEVWVAGRAATDRYGRAQVGVRSDQIREVGRPQLAEIERQRLRSADDTGITTVLYAPTWEGYYEAWSYSSVRTMGHELISRLLAMDGIRVIYKPHPATGSRNAKVAAEDRRIRELIRTAGEPHAVVTSLAGLYESFNEADILVSDISSVVTDFLYSRKPYIVCNPAGLEHDSFREQFPSTAAAALLDPGCVDLQAIVEDARGADVRSAQRARTAEYLLGASEQDPIQRFDDAIGEAIRLQHERDTHLTPSA